MGISFNVASAFIADDLFVALNKWGRYKFFDIHLKFEI